MSAKKLDKAGFKNTILSDYKLIFECRESSLLGRRDVLSGKGSFGIFERDQIDALDIPQMDHQLVWPFYDKRNLGFWGVNADFSSTQTKIKIEANPLK